jgi:hypothetical protein
MSLNKPESGWAPFPRINGSQSSAMPPGSVSMIKHLNYVPNPRPAAYHERT